MGRNLTFTAGGASYAVSPVKLEREKVYGWTEVQALYAYCGVCEGKKT